VRFIAMRGLPRPAAWGGMLAALTLALGLTQAVVSGSALAADPEPTEAQILDALKAKRLTRCPHATPASSCGEATPLSPDGTAPKIDIKIRFRYASAVLDPAARSALAALGAELDKPSAKEAVFLLAGHTDGTGSEAYNQGLSERRAEAVKEFLTENFKLSPDRLWAIGFGKSRLKNPGSPLAGENRRVQIVNTEIK
jgi:outer membrane protein OmpA-like peptidoglycan-associated protein